MRWFYRNRTPQGPNNSVTCVDTVANHAGQDVTDSVNFVAGKPASVTGNRLTTTAYQVDSAFGSDYAEGAREAYGFKSNMPAAANGKTFNFFATNNAPNYFRGITQVAANPGESITSTTSKTVTLNGDGVLDVARSSSGDGGCLGLRRSGNTNAAFVNFFSAATGDGTYPSSPQASIKLSGYGNVITTGITNTFSLSRTAAAPTNIVDSVAIVQALSPGLLALLHKI